MEIIGLTLIDRQFGVFRLQLAGEEGVITVHAVALDPIGDDEYEGRLQIIESDI